MHVNVGDEGSDTRRYMETSSCRPPVSPFHNGVAISVPWMGCGFRTLQCERIVVQTKCNTECKPMAVYTNGSVPMTLYTVCIHSNFQRHPTRAVTSPKFEQSPKKLKTSVAQYNVPSAPMKA